MALEALHDEVVATLIRLKKKQPDLKPSLEKAAGYAVFPSVGRGAALLGGAYGRGEVFADGESIGFASLGQVTFGVQLGGQTYSELVLFHNQDALDWFKNGRIAFAANASAVVLKAAASGTIDYERDVTAKAYGRGGMLLELSLGAQGFRFRPPEATTFAGGPVRVEELETEEASEAAGEEEGEGEEAPEANAEAAANGKPHGSEKLEQGLTKQWARGRHVAQGAARKVRTAVGKARREPEHSNGERRSESTQKK